MAWSSPLQRAKQDKSPVGCPGLRKRERSSWTGFQAIHTGKPGVVVHSQLDFADPCSPTLIQTSTISPRHHPPTSDPIGRKLQPDSLIPPHPSLISQSLRRQRRVTEKERDAKRVTILKGTMKRNGSISRKRIELSLKPTSVEVKTRLHNGHSGLGRG